MQYNMNGHHQCCFLETHLPLWNISDEKEQNAQLAKILLSPEMAQLEYCGRQTSTRLSRATDYVIINRCGRISRRFLGIEKCESRRVTDLFDGLVQERRNSIALAMELRLSCTNPSFFTSTQYTNIRYIS